jgi:putative membrane protein
MSNVESLPETKTRRSTAGYGLLFLKGFCMGAADVVPGVSGGTMALILGVYEELIRSVKSIDYGFLMCVFRLQWREAWQAAPFAFLIALGSGILSAIFSLARGLSWLLAHHPRLVWSFFFGLILASAFSVGSRIRRRSIGMFAGLGAGMAGAYWLVGLVPVETPESLLFIFGCGAVAICAMILPGISGAFILVLLGKYHFILEAVKQFNFPPLIALAAGAVVGLICFVRFLNWMLARHYSLTMATLTGLMLGSLRKIWPWKASAADPLLRLNNVWPSTLDAEVWLACGLALLGVCIVLLIQRAGQAAVRDRAGYLSAKNRKR